MVASPSVTLLSLHLLVDQPESVNVTRNVAQAERRQSSDKENNEISPVYIVKRMLIRRSQLHPVMNAAAAGGNRIAT